MAMLVELRRPLRYNKPSFPNLYHRVILIQDIETTLERVGGDDLVERFKQGPFGHFLGWSPGSSHSQVLHGILCRAIHSDRGILFVIRGKVVEYTFQDHALITGLCFGSTTFDPTLGYDPSQSPLCQTVCGDQSKTAKQLWDLFMEDLSPFDDDDGEIHIKLANLLVANIFILGHDDGKRPFSWLWQLADDTQAFNNFPWGAYSYMTLLHYVTHAKDTKRYHFYGPAWALIVWGLEVIGGLSDMAGLVYDYDLCPRCLRWHFARQLQSTTDRQFYAMLDDATLPIHRILPKDFEQPLEYYRTSLLPNALDVYFNVPVSASDDLSRAPRRRRPVHEPDADIVHVDGSRPRRSTQSRVYLGEDAAEPSGSGSRQPRHGRDLGKRAREPSSDRNKGHDRPVTRDEVREIVREVVAEEAKRVEGRVMNRITKYYEDLKALLSCRSRRSSPVHEPRRRSPPIVSSGRASGFASSAGTSGLDARDPTYGHVEDVGGRRDTTLSLNTVAPSHPSTELGGFESFAHQACSSIFGQLQSSTIPSFGQQYHPSYSDAPTQLHRYSMSEMSGTTFQFPTPGSALSVSSAPFVTTRDPARASASAVEVGQSSSGKAKSTYIPPLEPWLPPVDVQENFREWMNLGPDTFCRIDEAATTAVYVNDFQLMINPAHEWDATTYDLTLMALRTQLARGEHVLPSYLDGGLVLCNCSVTIELKADYYRLDAVADTLVGPGEDASVIKIGYIRKNWDPTNELLCVPKAHNLSYRSPNWWNASKVIIPWILDDGRYVPAVLHFSERFVYVMDPLYHDMDARSKMAVKVQFLPLLIFLPYWLHGTGFWRVNKHIKKIPQNPDFEWKIDFFRKQDLFTTKHPHCSGAVSCMNIERFFSACPSLKGDIDCCKYRQIMACRIWSHADI